MTAMRKFLHTHWKFIAILLAAVLLLTTVETDSADKGPPLAARLGSHVEALATPARVSSARYIDATLKEIGYRPHYQDAHGAGEARPIEVSVANLAPGVRAERLFIVGAKGGGTSAVLELARLLKDARPAPGTEVRFVFFGGDATDPGKKPGYSLGNFIAFAGSQESSARVRQALAAFHAQPNAPEHGLAAPAHVMGVTLSSHGTLGLNGYPSMMITDTTFLRYSYHTTQESAREASPDGTQRPDVESMARVVTGLARTLSALAGAAST